MKTLIPPIKCQGIKSKLVAWVRANIQWNGEGKWIEPFMGSGVVGFNVKPQRAVFCDNNPHLINFYNGINNGVINAGVVRNFLELEGKNLSKRGADYYYEVRERFNQKHEVLDFLFLNRACFNGVVRFNGKGGFNVPFGHKPDRFSKAYITKITNQVEWVVKYTRVCDWTFVCQDFRTTLSMAVRGDFIYCDPPYAGRHTDYFNKWTEEDEVSLCDYLKKSEAKFILSTWHSNQHRENPYITSLWSKFDIITREHFYHVGAKESNRNPMLEALVVSLVEGIFLQQKIHLALN